MSLSADELGVMRSELSASLPDTATIRRAVLASDGQGGKTEVWSNVGNVACRLYRVGTMANENLRGGAVTAESGWTATVPYSTDVRVTDRLVIGGRGFNVIGTDSPRSNELARRLELEEVST